MIDWDERYLALAEHISNWSKDPSTKVGCVIVSEDKVVVGTGYNGFPRGVEDTIERLTNRDIKYEMVQHAERNAIQNANCSLKGATAFVTHKPCGPCCGALIQAGISRIVSRPTDDGLKQRLAASYAATDEMLEDVGIEFREIA